MRTRDQIHADVTAEAARIVGTIQYARAATLYHDTRAESRDFDFNPPIPVRVLRPMPDDLHRWNDNNICDPVYPVAALRPSDIPAGWHFGYCYGTSWHMDGRSDASDFVPLPAERGIRHLLSRLRLILHPSHG